LLQAINRVAKLPQPDGWSWLIFHISQKKSPNMTGLNIAILE